MSTTLSVQDHFLSTLRTESIPVSVYLVNGIKLRGQIDSFDRFGLLLKSPTPLMVYKHAIACVVPAHAIGRPRDRV